MGTKKKLKSYIRDDRPGRLKSYAASHNLCLRSVQLEHRRNLLHYCAQYGTAEMLRYLLKENCDASQQDKMGNLPLHVAIERGLQEEIREARDTFLEIVTALLEVFPLGEDVENKEGVTGHDLLTLLRKKLKTAFGSLQHDFKQRVTSLEDEQENQAWRRKLSHEAGFEYEESLPRYSYEDDVQQETAQSMHDDEWFEKIGRDYKNKQSNMFWHERKRKGGELTGEPSSKKSSQQQKAEEKLRQAREKMKAAFQPAPVSAQDRTKSLPLKKQRYEKKFTHLLNHLSGQTLTFACIPWPSLDLHSVAEVLFCDLTDRSGEFFRKYLRAQQVRWHPDKFTQKFRDHLHPDHISKIMARVKAISQILNQLRSTQQK